jgi:hypothetical protein
MGCGWGDKQRFLVVPFLAGVWRSRGCRLRRVCPLDKTKSHRNNELSRMVSYVLAMPVEPAGTIRELALKLHRRLF